MAKTLKRTSARKAHGKTKIPKPSMSEKRITSEISRICDVVTGLQNDVKALGDFVANSTVEIQSLRASIKETSDGLSRIERYIQKFVAGLSAASTRGESSGSMKSALGDLESAGGTPIDANARQLFRT
jgi:hypothetical protein